MSIINNVFTQEVQNNIEKITYSLTIGDNMVKQEKIKNILRPLGFTTFKTGTNRICAFNEDHPDFAFKFAIDKRGIEDNEADVVIFDDPFVRGYVTPIYETNGLIEIAQRVKPFTSRRDFEENVDQIKSILSYLSDEYLLDDVGEIQWANWGIDAYGNAVILDFAYLERLEGMDLTCINRDPVTGRVCGADLGYNDTLTALQCPVCGARRTFADVKNTIDQSDRMMREINKTNEIANSWDADDYE